jgi:hypothetical protein
MFRFLQNYHQANSDHFDTLNILRQNDLGWPEDGSKRTETCRLWCISNNKKDIIQGD